MDDRDIAQLCENWLSFYRLALANCDRADVEAYQSFHQCYLRLESYGRELVEAFVSRWLDPSALSSLPPRLSPTSPIRNEERDAFFAAGAAVSLLAQVVEIEVPTEKRKLVALIHRFLSEVSRYLSTAQLIGINANIHRRPVRTLRQMADGIVIKPSQSDLDKIVELDRRKNESRAALERTGKDLAIELVQHSLDPKGVLQVIHRANAGGGPPKVSEIWESVKIDLQQNLITLTIQQNPTSHGTQTLTDTVDRFESAYQSFQIAERKIGRQATDAEAYEWLREHGVDGYTPPAFETWQRYVRGGRKAHDDQKNSSRADRTGRSIARPDEL